MFEPLWKKKGLFLFKKKEPESEEERLKKLRDMYAETIIEIFPKRIDPYYYDNMIDEIREDMEYIAEYLEYDNERLRDKYLDDQIYRTEEKINKLQDYTEQIKFLSNTINTNKEKLEKLILEKNDLQNQIDEINKNKKGNIRTPAEAKILDRFKEIDLEKIKFEEEITKLTPSLEILSNSQEKNEALKESYFNYIDYIHENWERYYHNGSHIILPSIE